MVGFLLVGSAFAAVVRGPLMRKVLWLVGGMVLLWNINLGRIMFIFWAGRTWGEHVAISVLHPFVGMVTFSLSVMAMVLVIKTLGMSIGIGQAIPLPRTAVGSSSSRSDRRAAVRATVAPAVPKVYWLWWWR